MMAFLLPLTLFQHLIDGFHNRDRRNLVADLLGVTSDPYTAAQMTYDLRRLRLKGLIFRPQRTNRYFVTPYGWKVARLFRPAVAKFTANDAVLPIPLRQALDRADSQFDLLIYDAFRRLWSRGVGGLFAPVVWKRASRSALSAAILQCSRGCPRTLGELRRFVLPSFTRIGLEKLWVQVKLRAAAD